MPHYPVMLNITGKLCVIVGGGRVAYRKAQDLLECGAAVTVISPFISDEMSTLTQQYNHLHCIQTAYQPGIIEEMQPFMVIAATDHREVNQQIIAEANTIGILVSAADQSTESDFTGMSSFRRGRITVGVSTEGASPALAKLLREELEAVVVPGYEILADQLAVWRMELSERIADSQIRGEIWRRLLAQKTVVMQYLQQDATQARSVFEITLEEVIKEHLG